MSYNELRVYREKAKYHPKVFEYFDFNKLDAFHNQDILTTIYENNWDSVLITERDKVFLHVFSKQAINDSGWYDIEPFIGYNGIVVNTDDRSFIGRALETYSALCKEEKIIAEVVRFNCILRYHSYFGGNGFPISIAPVKDIVIVDCFNDAVQQMYQFCDPCRRRIRKGLEECEFRMLNKEKEGELFARFYMESLERVESGRHWYFDPNFFERINRSKHFNIYGVWHKKKLASAALIIEQPLAAYYLLAGNSVDLIPGAGELLIFRIAQMMARRGIHNLVLGGGNTPAFDDPLLRFKKKFATTTRIFYIGKMVHNPEIFDELCNDAIQKNDGISKSNFFLKYRLTL